MIKWNYDWVVPQLITLKHVKELKDAKQIFIDPFFNFFLKL
jgi:hypothetical protein